MVGEGERGPELHDCCGACGPVYSCRFILHTITSNTLASPTPLQLPSPHSNFLTISRIYSLVVLPSFLLDTRVVYSCRYSRIFIAVSSSKRFLIVILLYLEESLNTKKPLQANYRRHNRAHPRHLQPKIHHLAHTRTLGPRHSPPLTLIQPPFPSP